MNSSNKHNHLAFTLIELSIVMVIIGLIVGGVLVGRDLIKAAEVRSQISQIEKLNTATNTFRGKFNALPGDIAEPDASNFGFKARGQYAGEGDGNGLIEGITSDSPDVNFGFRMGGGETLVFWVDLSTARLIDGGFTAGRPNVMEASSGSFTNFATYFPQAKLGNSFYIFATSGGTCANGSCAATPKPAWNSDGYNYFSISAPLNIGSSGVGQVVYNGFPYGGIPVSTAYAIDKKVDDAAPMGGKVTARALCNAGIGYAQSGPACTYVPFTSATSASATTCYDNGGVAGPMQYSVSQNNGAGANCGLTFQFQ